MKRREFLKASLLGGAAAAVAPMSLLGGCTEGEKKKTAPELKISFQEGTAPGDTLEERLDFMEQNGVVGFEPGGVNLAGRINEFDQIGRAHV